MLRYDVGICMSRFTLLVLLTFTAIAGTSHQAIVLAQPADLSGRWQLNHELSEFPKEVGFDADWAATSSGQTSTTPGGQSRRGSPSAASPFSTRRQSEDDVKRERQLTAEVRTPSERLTIAQDTAAVTIASAKSVSRTIHPNGRQEVIQLDGVPVSVTSRWEGDRLVVSYLIDQDRELRYTYGRSISPSHLIVDVQFLEKGKGDRVRRIYEPSTGVETTPADTTPAAPPAAPSAPSRPGSPTAPAPARPAAPAPEPFNQQQDAELKGLTSLGLVVEDLSQQARACGLNQSTLEAGLAKRLTDAGFTVARNSDEDTYLYVLVMTTSSAGTCISRYDAFLYTHTTAQLSYQTMPVLVQVSLLHKGGLAGGGAATHADAVVRGLQEYVDQFATRIRNAGK